jgi:acyl-coenzyme A synthetase/AMP-(fatty) acid ligase
VNIVDPILFHARHSPQALAICAPGTSPATLTYGELDRWMNNISRLALLNDLDREQIVAVNVSEKILHLAIVLALSRLGIPTISSWAPVLPSALKVATVITDQKLHFKEPIRVILTDASWKQPHDRPLADQRFYETNPTDPCRTVLTSGTTGEPRAVAFTQGMLVSRVQRFEFVQGSEFSACRRLYCDLGIQLGVGFLAVLYMLWRGGAVFLFGADSESIVRAFDLYKVEGMITTPHGLSKYLQFYELPGTPECSFQFVVCLGAPLPSALAARAKASMSPRLYNVYGSTECSQTAAGPVDAFAQVPGAVGYVTPDMAVEIVDHADQNVPLGREGIIRIKSRQSVTEYVGDPAATTAAFRRGWFYPGDLGSLDSNGMLRITGRTNSLINIGGDKIKPELVEEALVSLGKVQEAAAFAHLDPLGVAELWVAVVSPDALDQATLQSVCAESLGAPYVPRRVFRVAALPKSDVGKLDRLRLALLPELRK